ncbi:methyl-accepting chemotaxis protein [Paenibacillus sp. S-38]|uniref:methyl-accepting chemotaxis protein n=1 Tax=Paenibacillus sp. S-38 TaxID=3416710 RepID=UPI003CF033FE
MNRQPWRHSLGIRIALIVMGILITMNLLNTVYLYYHTQSVTELAVANRSIDTAVRLAKAVDPMKYKEFLEDPQENGVYWELRDQLSDFREKNGVLYVYTIQTGSGGENPQLFIDGAPRDDANYSPIGEPTSTTTPEMVLPVLKGGTISTPIVNDEKYGDYLSAFAPIKDASGQVLGILGVDTSADTVDVVTSEVMKASMPLYVGSIIGITLLFIALAMVYIIRRLSPLLILKRTVETMAEGDLGEAGRIVRTLQVTSKDEIGSLTREVGRMIGHLQEMIAKMADHAQQVARMSGELSAAAEETAGAATQVAADVREVASGAETQQVSAEESARAMEEMAAGIVRIAESASCVSDRSKLAFEEARQGTRTIGSVMEQMGSIQDTAHRSAAVIRSLNDRSHEIEQILGGITAIANQTNLLALNASIEASRAGEHGRGFSVVAQEVRKLAEQSKHAADQVVTVIKEIQQDTGRAVDAMTAQVSEVELGLQLAGEATGTFQRIFEVSHKVADQILEVSSASEQISAGAEEVTATVGDMANIARTSAQGAANVAEAAAGQLASADQVSEASGELRRTAAELQELVGRFTLE